MSNKDASDVNQIAFRQLKPTIDSEYPLGRFVAIDGGQIVADAADIAELERILTAQRRHCPNVLVIQVGQYLPEYVHILL